ncbi:hypothetical protein E4K10_48225 [Streptomyces sp. T1317-0309]|nr:hypothetical protein E4K10_48225 [Streptomyces sp. T1317-0309]
MRHRVGGRGGRGRRGAARLPLSEGRHLRGGRALPTVRRRGLGHRSRQWRRARRAAPVGGRPGGRRPGPCRDPCLGRDQRRRGQGRFHGARVQGQTRAITEAWAAAGLEPAQAQYLEAHGTGTELGDQVEIAAAAAAFHAAERGGIALGSVKANIGHLDAAAGIAQLAKTVLMLENRLLVPSPGVTRPHPDLARSPFRLVLQTSEWQVPRTAYHCAQA